MKLLDQMLRQAAEAAEDEWPDPYEDAPLARRMCPYQPGSDFKIVTMILRVQFGFQPHHPFDRRL